MLCNSLMNNDGMLAADKTIKLNPATALLHYDVGDEIRLSESDFLLLSEAFLAEVESKYL